MMCYKDRTFCSAKCKTYNCNRNYTDAIRQEAREWWNHDPDNVPVAFSDFSKGCKEYKP